MLAAETKGPTMSNKTDFDPRFDPAFQPGYEKQASTGAADQSPARAALTSATTGERSIVVDGVTTTQRNPFVGLLLGIGVVLIVGGVVVIRSLGAAFDSVDIQVDLDYYTLDVLKVIGPLLITLGSATLIGVAFVKAVQWKSARE
jgi:hypothetical protein